MKKVESKKLRLHRETLALLNEEDLRGKVRGGTEESMPKTLCNTSCIVH